MNIDAIKKSLEGIGPVEMPAIYLSQYADLLGDVVTRGIITKTGQVEIQAPHMMLEAGQACTILAQYVLAGHRVWTGGEQAMNCISGILFAEIVRLRADLDAARAELAAKQEPPA